MAVEVAGGGCRPTSLYTATQCSPLQNGTARLQTHRIKHQEKKQPMARDAQTRGYLRRACTVQTIFFFRRKQPHFPVHQRAPAGSTVIWLYNPCRTRASGVQRGDVAA
mmetsp:Transcript_89331/g.149105  ORF Transcript_89331/g.149105 Transcript_89331/m.149105 type:complete len:108 (-) Transcript_89331:270-593(-)